MKFTSSSSFECRLDSNVRFMYTSRIIIPSWHVGARECFYRENEFRDEDLSPAKSKIEGEWGNGGLFSPTALKGGRG